MMQEERNFNPMENSHERKKKKYKKTSKWQDALGYEIKHEIAKQMFKNSKLLPPPPKTQFRQEKYYKDQMSTNRIRVRAIFRRIFSDNASKIRMYNEQQSQGKIDFLSDEACKAFLVPYEEEAQKKFNKLSNLSKDMMKESLYDDMDEALDEMSHWLDNVQKVMKRKYQETIKFYQQVGEKKRKYEQLSNCLKVKRDYAMKEAYDNDEEMSDEQGAMMSNLRILENEIQSLTRKEEPTPEAVIRKALIKAKQKKWQRHSSSSSDEE